MTPTHPKTLDTPTLAAVTLTVLAWASAFVAIRWVGETLDPGPLALGRLLIGSAALGTALALRRRWTRPTGREWGLLTLCGLTWFAIYNVTLNAGEQHLDAGTAAMLISIGPILIALLAGTVLREGFPRWLLAGAALAFTGALLIGIPTARHGHSDLAGVTLCLTAAVTYAIGVLAEKPVLRRLPSLQATWIVVTIGALACTPYTPTLADQLTPLPTATLGLVYLGLIPTALAFVTWAYALARMDAGRLGVTTYLVPPIATLAGWATLGEVPAGLSLVGGLVCLIGVGLSRRRGRTEPTATSIQVADKPKIAP